MDSLHCQKPANLGKTLSYVWNLELALKRLCLDEKQTDTLILNLKPAAYCAI